VIPLSTALKIPELPVIEAPAPSRASIVRLEKSMRDLPQVECPLQHTFARGMYARTVLIPAGTVAVGKIHRHQHISIVAMGDVTVATESGLVRVQAPYMVVAPPGTKRAVYAHTDTLWTTFHASEETDLEKLEAELIAPDYESLEFDGHMKELLECRG
jgi:quercetin dioxygenase-like cupin family protein